MRKIVLVLAVVLLLAVNGFCADVEVPNPIKELFDWTFQQSVGATYVYDVDGEVNHIGAIWNLFKSKHDWLYAGLCASTDPSLGYSISFNVGKLIEKIKGEPLIYLKHLEVGYSRQFTNIQDLSEGYDGIMLNAIKFEF